MNSEYIALRKLIGDTLNKKYEQRDDIYVIDSDLAGSTTTVKFKEQHPDRFVETGIAEANAMSIAAGIAAEGKTPFYVNFAIFVTGTAWTQLRQACYANLNVKLIGTHPGMDGGYDGATHHALEDIALTRVLPNLKVLVPSTAHELEEAIQIALDTQGPVYIRCARGEVPNLKHDWTPTLGKSYVIADEGNDFAIVFEGSSAGLAIDSYEEASKRGLKGKLINVFSIKPLDVEFYRELSLQVERIITIENHSRFGGLGSVLAEATADMKVSAPIYRVGVNDTFTESGPADEVKKKYGLNVDNVLSYIDK